MQDLFATTFLMKNSDYLPTSSRMLIVDVGQEQSAMVKRTVKEEAIYGDAA